jgi:hypothetical protein
MPVNIDQDADAQEAKNEIGTAVADEGQRESFVGQHRSRHPDIHRGLEGDHDHDAEAEKHAKPIPRAHRDDRPAEDDDEIREDDEERATQSEFFTDYRKDEIGVGER